MGEWGGGGGVYGFVGMWGRCSVGGKGREQRYVIIVVVWVDYSMLLRGIGSQSCVHNAAAEQWQFAISHHV